MSEERIAPDHTGEAGEWEARPWLLALLLGAAGLLIHFVTDARGADGSPMRMALAALLFFGPLCAAFSLERDRWKDVLVFALIAGLVMAGLAWRATGQGDSNGGYGFGAGVIAAILSLPLFQAGFRKTRFATPYRAIHFHGLTDAVCAAGSLFFVGATWLMLVLLATLFALLDMEFLANLIEDPGFAWTISGLAFGAALGVLRNKLAVLHTLQAVVLLVLSLLAVPLAAGLAFFLVAMIVFGPDTLWEATRYATPVLLTCAAGAFVLANAVVREDDTDMTRSRVMRVTSLVLALVILPLTVFAAISMGTRISAYGLAPERLWGLMAIIVACAVGLAYFVAVVRGRLAGWRDQLRNANINLAVGISVFALFLALPILDFNTMSTSSQLARLESGAVSTEDFDYEALRWDFGAPGREALEQLASGEDEDVAGLAAAAQAHEYRRWRSEVVWEDRDQRIANLTFQFDNPDLQDEITRRLIDEFGRCYNPCTVLDLGQEGEELHIGLVEDRSLQHFKREASGEIEFYYPEQRTPATTAAAIVPVVEVRTFEGRRVYVDGEPIGVPFD